MNGNLKTVFFLLLLYIKLERGTKVNSHYKRNIYINKKKGILIYYYIIGNCELHKNKLILEVTLNSSILYFCSAKYLQHILSEGRVI